MEIINSFNKLKEKTDSSPTIAEILAILSRIETPMLLILFSLPFAQPIQIPGFSIPFGILIGLLGLQIAFHYPIWLPKFILNKSVSKGAVNQVCDKGIWFIKEISKIASTRWVFISRNPAFQTSNGLMIFILGSFLAIPLPIPFSNMVAAWAVLFFSVGLLVDDGVFILMGYVIIIFCILFFVGIYHLIF